MKNLKNRKSGIVFLVTVLAVFLVAAIMSGVSGDGWVGIFMWMVIVGLVGLILLGLAWLVRSCYGTTNLVEPPLPSLRV